MSANVLLKINELGKMYIILSLCRNVVMDVITRDEFTHQPVRT